MVDGGRRAAEKVLERAEEERLAARERVAPLEFLRKPLVEVAAPRRRVGVGRLPEAGEVVAVEVVVSVHEAGRERRAVEVDGDVRRAFVPGDAAALDVESARVCDETELHRANLRASRSGMPVSRA